MRRYALVSGTFLTLFALVHVTRLIFGWPLRAAGVDVPVWFSVAPMIVFGGLAAWAFRVATGSEDAA